MTSSNLSPAARPEMPNLRHGFYSPKLSPRAREVAASVLEAPWSSELDRLGAEEIGRLVSVAEELDRRIGLGTHASDARLSSLVDLRLRVSSKLVHLLDRYGMTPHARANWAARLQAAAVWDSIREGEA